MSASPVSPNSPGPKRNSLTQLPLPNAVNSPPPKSSPPVAGPSSPTRTAHMTAARPGQQPPSRANYTGPVHSATHASGILPSASFFRPSRPNQQPQYYRDSAGSETDGLPHPRDGDLFQMASLTKQISNSSDGHDDVAQLDSEQFSSKKRAKKSREPLLPLVDRNPLSARPSISRERSAGSNASKGAKAMVRNSLDRVFNLSRGMSVDSLHKPSQPQSSRRVPKEDDVSMDDTHTFEGKLRDEETGIYDSTRESYPGRKDSTSPGMYGRHLGIAREASPQPTVTPSPDQSFVPTLPIPGEDLSAVPRKHPETGEIVRNYQLHPSRNGFFLKGRIMHGGDSPWAFVAAFSVLVCITGVWFGTTAVWWWNNESPAVAIVVAYLAIMTIVTMLTAATSDPGILPRNLDPDPPYPANSPSDGGLRAPMPRDLKVRADVVRVKYCQTCLTYRPPRSSHCKMCDNCVDGCDHHCQWVNNCVGHRNYTVFFVLLVAATLSLILIIVTSALHLYFMTVKEDISFGQSLRKGAGSAVAFCLSILVVWPVGALLSYHMRLLLLNITTIEQIRNQAHKTLVPGPAPTNPFSHGSPMKNLMAVLCRPTGYSWLDPHGIATEDKREVNPGLVDD